MYTLLAIHHTLYIILYIMLCYTILYYTILYYTVQLATWYQRGPVGYMHWHPCNFVSEGFIPFVSTTSQGLLLSMVLFTQQSTNKYRLIVNYIKHLNIQHINNSTNNNNNAMILLILRILITVLNTQFLIIHVNTYRHIIKHKQTNASSRTLTIHVNTSSSSFLVGYPTMTARGDLSTSSYYHYY